MSSKNNNTKSKFLLRTIYAIFALLLLFFVSLYLFVPSYHFEDAKPFSGKFIHNPYQNITNYNWDYIDFRNDTIFNCYEYGYGISSSRYLCIDFCKKRKIDYPFFQNIHFKQHNINCLNKKTSLVALTNIDNGFKTHEIKHLDNYRLLEVASKYGIYFNYWDLALSSGRRVNILATSDDSNKNDFEYKTVVNSGYTDKEQIIKSLNDGDFYAVSYKKGNDNLPELKSVFLSNDSIFVATNKTIKKLYFIGQDGIIKDTLHNVNQGFYVFKDDDSYIRINMDFDDGTTIYLNPIVRHQFQYFFDPSLSETMKEKTWLMRIIYIFVIIFSIKYLLSNKKDNANENKR